MTESFLGGNAEKCGWRSPSDEAGLPHHKRYLKAQFQLPGSRLLDSDERFDTGLATMQPPIEPERSICFPWNCSQRIQQRLASDYRRYTPPRTQTRTLPDPANR